MVKLICRELIGDAQPGRASLDTTMLPLPERGEVMGALERMTGPSTPGVGRFGLLASMLAVAA
jgi:hypothetical protein